MRDDMRKVLCERPRRGGNYSYHDYRRSLNSAPDLEDLPAKQGMRRPYLENWGDCKTFSDLIGPLVRFFESRVGHRWDDVWSEVCSRLKGGGTLNDHLKDHARDMVATNTVVVDGYVYVRGGRRYGAELRPPSEGELYVDPVSRVICRMPRTQRARPKYCRYGQRHFRIEEDGTLSLDKLRWKIIQRGQQEAVRLDGVWYWVIFEEVPPPLTSRWMDHLGKVREHVIHRSCTDIVTGETRSSGRYRAGKRQMSSRDLRRHGLRNQ